MGAFDALSKILVLDQKAKPLSPYTRTPPEFLDLIMPSDGKTRGLWWIKDVTHAGGG